MTPIRVTDLIAILSKMPQDAFVLTEGCDCNGPCSGAELSGNQVLLRRDDNIPTYCTVCCSALYVDYATQCKCPAELR